MCSATKLHITPLQVEAAHPVSDALTELVGVPVAVTGINALTFTVEDLQAPFISHNDAMWSYFEPELRRRLSQLEVDDSISARVRAVLVELLPVGENTIESVARKLATSSRTLQRQLSEEETTFRKQLNHVRQLLAQTVPGQQRYGHGHYRVHARLRRSRQLCARFYPLDRNQPSSLSSPAQGLTGRRLVAGSTSPPFPAKTL